MRIERRLYKLFQPNCISALPPLGASWLQGAHTIQKRAQNQKKKFRPKVIQSHVVRPLEVCVYFMIPT